MPIRSEEELEHASIEEQVVYPSDLNTSTIPWDTQPSGLVTIKRSKKPPTDPGRPLETPQKAAPVVQLRRNVPPAGFGAAIRTLRKVAHDNGLVVASPCRLVGAELTGFGESDELQEGAASYKLINADLLFDGLWLKEKDKASLALVADKLLEMGGMDIAESFAPPAARLATYEDEKQRWYLRNDKGHAIGLIVRTGDGAHKRYMLHLWDGQWFLQSGPPPFDLPVFGLEDLLRNPGKPVMVHEGPKAWQGAMAAADPRVSSAHLANWMSRFVHVGWHGAEHGIEVTDWSPLRGREVLIWSDMDEAGVTNAIVLARRLARMGEIVGYVNWGADEIAKFEGWDWGDPMNGLLANTTRFDILKRTRKVESAFLTNGAVSPRWAKRSALDRDKQEIYQSSNGYRPRSLEAFSKEYGQGAVAKIYASSIRDFGGRTFKPGVKPGFLGDGRINTCPENPREPIAAAPLARGVYRELRNDWLARMIPDVRQRKHLLRKAAWAIVRPEKISQHMVVMQGVSGIGKSVLMDLICAVAGDDRASAVYPDSIFKSFNDSIKDRCIVCIHEIHSDDISRKQNASRLKELIGNSHITVREKYRSDELRENAIHWFGATNERVPFALEHGNDRFFFVRCAGPESPPARARMRKFFATWLDRFKDQVLLDQLYAAAKHIVLRLNSEQVAVLVGRARRQKVWSALERASLRPWEQFLVDELDAIFGQEAREGEDHPPVFFGSQVVTIVRKEFPRLGPADVRAKLVEFGYRRVKNGDGSGAKKPVRKGDKKRETIWARKSDLDAVEARGDIAGLMVRTPYESLPG